MFQVKDEINNIELEEPTGTDSELKPDCHSYSTIPADRNVIIEVRYISTTNEKRSITITYLKVKRTLSKLKYMFSLGILRLPVIHFEQKAKK